MNRDEIDTLEQAALVLAGIGRRGIILAEDLAEGLLRLLDLADLTGLVLDGDAGVTTSQ